MLAGTDLLDRLVEACPAPLIVSDLRGRILVFNAAAVAVLGYGAEEARAFLHVTDLYHRPEEARRVMDRLRALDAGTGHAEGIDATLRARNGELVPVRLAASLVRGADGHAVATLGIFEDRREQIALGRRLEEATGQVLESERRAAGMALAHAAAHEMSQPLTAAMGNLEMIATDEQVPEDVRSRVERARVQLERLRRIVTEFARAGVARARAESN
ncbi:MAG: PAS domain-containing protein [Myxococcota bacterium]